MFSFDADHRKAALSLLFRGKVLILLWAAHWVTSRTVLPSVLVQPIALVLFIATTYVGLRVALVFYEPPRCAAATVEGRQCRNPPSEGEFCYVHDDMDDVERFETE